MPGRARQLHADASCLGMASLTRRGVQRDEAQAAVLLRAAARQSYSPAQTAYGLLLRDDRGMPADPVAAWKWLDLAALDGDQVALQARGTLTARLPPATAGALRRDARLSRPKTGPLETGAAGRRAVCQIRRTALSFARFRTTRALLHDPHPHRLHRRRQHGLPDRRHCSPTAALLRVAEPRPAVARRYARSTAMQPASTTRRDRRRRVVVLAVKPPDPARVALGIARPCSHARPLVVSIAARRAARRHRPLARRSRRWCARCQNAPALVKSGATALYAAAGVGVEQRRLAGIDPARGRADRLGR